MNKLHKLLIIALILIMGGNTLKAENLTATRNSDTELVTKNQDLHSHDNFITNDNHVVSALAASAAYNGTPVTPTKIDESNYQLLGLTEENWSDYSGYYAIRNASELYGFAALVNGGNRSVNGVLLQDIVVNTTVSASGAVYSWIPIGATRETAFLGTFDGAGHSISGIYYKNADATHVGLFGNIGEYNEYTYATVKNLTLKNSYIYGKQYVGGIVGCLWGNNATVANCKTDSDVSVVSANVYGEDISFRVGGIVGSHYGTTMGYTNYVTNCVSFASVTGTFLEMPENYGLQYEDDYIAAITGSWQAGINGGEIVTVRNCYYLKNSVKVTAGDRMIYANWGRGGVYQTDGSVKLPWQDNVYCTILESASAAHTCVAVATPEIKANCTYGGHSAYSYCLICGGVTNGTKTLTEATNVHQYEGATCTVNGVCRICGDIGSKDPDNHVGGWDAANCIAPATCVSCSATKGEKDPDNHVGGWEPATCIAPATCVSCSGTKGEKNPDNHVDSDSYTYEINEDDESKHDAFYEQCGALAITEAHSYDAEGKCEKCLHQCAHPTYTEGVCDVCAYKCKHNEFVNNVCSSCGQTNVVSYLDRVWNSSEKRVEESLKNVADVIEITSETTELSDGWYIVRGTVDITDIITVKGTVNLILADGASLTSRECLVNSGNALYIYAQSSGASMGSWTLKSGLGTNAALGGKRGEGAGRIVINGGSISASVTGSKFAAVIGGGNGGAAGEIIINGGSVQVSGSGTGAGIGGGAEGAGGSVTINGGVVTASSTIGAAIGGGAEGSGVSITINGGVVTATTSGKSNGAAIGSGRLGSFESVVINGGTISAISRTGSAWEVGLGDGIGDGRNGTGGMVILNGGNVYASSAKGSDIKGPVKNGNGSSVTLSTITLSGAAADTPVTKVEGITYGLTDVKTYNTDKLYFYLPANAVATSITAGGVEYICNSNLTYYTAHTWDEELNICTVCGYHTCSFDENGVCTICDTYQPATLVTNENYESLGLAAEYVGFYQIGNAGQLYWFANHINTVDRTASAVLTADIDLEGKPDGTGRHWTPIGSTGENSNNFRGVFDGQNHTITGLYVEGGRAGLGFFGEVRTGTVKNFTIYGEVVVNTEVDYVGGVIGSTCGLNGSDHGLERNGATIQNITSYVNLTAKTHGIGRIGGFIGYANHETLIENCSWHGTFDAGIYRVDSGAGGFIGRIYDSANVTIRNCAAYGTIMTSYKSGTFNSQNTIYIGGFLSHSPSGAKTVMENNLWAGQIENETDLTKENAHLSAYGTLSSDISITNCYALALDSTLYVTTNNENTNGITTVTAERLASGEIAYLLQGEQETQVWGQNIDNGEMADAYPVLGGAKVYKHTFDFGNINVYSNLETLDMTPHGKCGDYLYWNITENTLTIFGTGAMYDYAYEDFSPWYTHKGSLKTLVLEEGMTSIGKHAFRDCSGFTGDLIIPNRVTSIGDYAFYLCSGFTGDLTIPNSVTTIGESAFNCCSGFTGSLTIPNSVTSIGTYAFCLCRNFTGSLTIPNSVTSIGNYAFYLCRNFTGSLTIPNSVTSIGNYAFYNCYGFTGELIIPNSVTTIGQSAFEECSGFTGSLTIPNSVTSIGRSAFYGCSGLSEIFFYRNESPSIANINAFANINSNAKIYAPVIWESFTNIPEDKLVKMPTWTSQQVWVGLAEGQTEPGENEHVAINAPLLLSQRDNETTSQQVNSLRVKSFGYCGDGTTTNGSITIEEGGQLYCETARGEVTVRKEIIGYAGQQTTDNGQQTSWYTIASPLKEAIDLSNSNTFITSTPFDLYRYDEPSHTWQNAKEGEGSTNFQTIEPGRGYLYANAENTTLEFTGDINTEDVNYTLTAQSEVLNGFHLVGNPYTHDISFNHLSADAELANGYYVLNGEGAWGATLGNEGDVIKVGQGALIKTISAGTLRISKSTSQQDNESISRDASNMYRSRRVAESPSRQVLKLSVANSNYSDKAFVVFEKGVGLDKINHENENVPLLYIPQDGTDYAIAMMDENVSEIPVSFEAMTMGQYTISLQQENCDFEELYLLDKETGEKVNILEEDYTFMATTADNAERFVLLKDNGQQTTDNSHFAYVSGEDLIISVEGKVQIIDVMGRIIYSNDVTSDNSRIDVSGFDNAAYVVRVVNEEGVKVQKIIL